MPDVDGFALVSAMASDARFAKVPIIMLTSAGRVADRARRRVAPCLTKPVKQSELLDAILTAFAGHRRRRRAGAGRAVAACAATAPAHSRRRRQRDQPAAGRRIADAVGPYRDGSERRPRGGVAVGPVGVRRRADGRADAGDERPRCDRGHPRSRASRDAARTDRRHDGPCDGKRSRAVPDRGHGCLRFEAGQGPRSVRDHRAGHRAGGRRRAAFGPRPHPSPPLPTSSTSRR